MTVKEYNNIVEQWADNIYRFVLSNARDEEVAKDVVQDTFEKFWIKKDSIELNKAKSYLFTTAHHTFIDYVRKNKRITDFGEVDFNLHKEYNQYSDINEILHQAISQLPEKQHSVILLRDYEGYNYDEIAERTDLSLSQVKVYIFRGRSYLKKILGSVDTLI